MPISYETGKVYVILNTKNDMKYVGSTVRTLAQRMANHRKAAKTTRARDECLLYDAMRDFGVEHFYIELVKDHPCDRKEQLSTEEGKSIREMKSLAPNGYNMRVAGRTRAEYREEHATQIKACKHDFHARNRDELNARSRENYAANKEARKASNIAYHQLNKDAIAAKRKEHYEAHKEEILAKNRVYRERRAAAASPAPEPAEA